MKTLKNIVFALLMTQFSMMLYAQTPTFTDKNRIHTVTPQIPISIDSLNLVGGLSAPDAERHIQAVAYYDGLGRPWQNIAIAAGAGNEDIISHSVYDAYGRQALEYLPYAQSGSNGLLRLGAVSEISAFYNTAKYENTSNPYSEKQFEASPLSRVLKQAAPGYDWRMGGGHEIKMDYLLNTYDPADPTNPTNDNVRRFDVSFTGGNTEAPQLVASTSSYYNSGELTKMLVKDENWTTGKDHTTEEFKDKQGMVILKRTYNAGIAHDTYYVYDDFGNLTYVLPPKVDTSDGVSATELSELCYQYKYDHRNRLVEKKIPGKDWEYIVYNHFDQPILAQDANLRAANQWLYTKYDVFGRVVYTGIFSSSLSRTAVQTAADAVTTQFESRQPSAVTLGDGSAYYSNVAYPNTALSTLHTVTYYDNYSNLGSEASGMSVPATVKGQAKATNTQGLATISKVRVLTTNNWITSIIGYDQKGRSIYAESDNPYLGTHDKVETALDFAGKVTQTTTTHTRGATSVVTTDDFKYDHMGRLTLQTQTLGGNTEVIVQNVYDELGQLVQKKVGNTVTTPLQTVDYAYNVRGWLKSINDINNPGTDLFNFRIGYNEGADPLYNGNISQTQWRTTNTDTSIRTYSYSYDALNRILTATDNTTDQRYSLSGISYDKNGNIITLQRNGHTNVEATTFGAMDNLTYVYDAGNKLTKVTDTGNSTIGFADGANIATEYTYDANGNMKTDANKGLTDITYNYLNLPTQITTANGNISYIYDAAGGKLRKVVNETGVGTTTTDYAGNYIYENSSLKFFSHPEGYVDTENGNKYVYQYKDHLGNVRLSYLNIGTTGLPNLEIQEENNYYPFGLKQKGYNSGIGSYANIALKRKFNGIELEQGLGVNLYEMDLRKYDPALARWTGIDPIVHHSLSTYNAFDNNPVYWADPSGADSQQVECNTCDVFGRSTTENGRYVTVSERQRRKRESEDSSDESKPQEPEDGNCCQGLKNWYNKLLDQLAGGMETQWGPQDDLEYWNGDDGYTYAITADDQFYKIGIRSWERVDVLPPSVDVIPIGLPSGGVARGIVANGKAGKKALGTVVYFAKEGGKKTGKVIYVGITNNFAVRAATHLRKRGFKIEGLLKDLSRSDARSVEQALIEGYGLGGKLGQKGQLLNRINSISQSNPRYAEYLEKGYELLKAAGFNF